MGYWGMLLMCVLVMVLHTCFLRVLQKSVLSADVVGWVREGLPVLGNLAGPIQHFEAAVLEGWRSKVSADFCAGKGFRGGPRFYLDWYLAAP